MPPIASYLSLLLEAKNCQIAIAGSTGGSLVACSHIAKALKEKGYVIAGELPVKSFPKMPCDEELGKMIDSNLGR